MPSMSRTTMPGFKLVCFWCDHPAPTHTRGRVCQSCGARLPVFVIPHIEPVIGHENIDELPENPPESQGR